MKKDDISMADAHCHLQDPRILPMAEAVILRARSAGVRLIHCCGTRESDWDAVLAIGARHPEVSVSLGLHPWHLSGRSEGWLERLRGLLERNPAGVGEIGLDHALPGADRGDQAAVFIGQLRLAKSLGRPVTIHCRKAWGALVEILRAEGGLSHGGLIHAYAGSRELVPVFEGLGCHLSFSGTITRPGNRRAKTALPAVDPRRLLIETDSPDLLPEGAPGPHNEPSELGRVLVAAAAARDTSPESLGKLTSENFRKLFEGILK